MKLKFGRVAFLTLFFAGTALGLSMPRLLGGLPPPTSGMVPAGLTTFQSGTTAKADEVNGNFQKLTDAMAASKDFLDAHVIGLNAIVSSMEAEIAGRDAEIAALRATPIQRPAFRSTGATSIVIPATQTSPGRVLIGGTRHAFTSDLSVDMGTGGIGGLDLGSIAASKNYYAYIVVGVGGGSVGGIVSLNPPTTSGPIGFAAWTYIGSFLTNSAGEISPFVFANGRCTQWLGAPDVTSTSLTTTARTILIPPHATSVYGRFVLNGSGVNPDDRLVAGPTAGATLTILVAASTFSAIAYATVPVFESSTIYLAVSDTTTTAAFRVLGWSEEPSTFP